MPRYITHYRRNKTVRCHIDRHFEGRRLDHTAGNQFDKRGVGVGDFVYMVTIEKGQLFLIGRMQVGKLASQRQAEALLDCPPWPAEQHLMAKKGSGTPQRFKRPVPLKITQRLRFVSPGGKNSPKFGAPGKLDRQTLRGVGELTADSAGALNTLLSLA